jgi:hypothetical protein
VDRKNLLLYIAAPYVLLFSEGQMSETWVLSTKGCSLENWTALDINVLPLLLAFKSVNRK